MDIIGFPTNFRQISHKQSSSALLATYEIVSFEGYFFELL